MASCCTCEKCCSFLSGAARCRLRRPTCLHRCSEIEKIIAVDKKAVQFEKDKLEAMGSQASPKDIKIVAEAEKAIAKQVEKLQRLQKTKGCQ